MSRRDRDRESFPDGDLPGVVRLDAFFDALFLLFVLWTITFQLGRWLQLPFSSVCYAWIVESALAAIALVTARVRRGIRERAVSGRSGAAPAGRGSRAAVGLAVLSALFFLLEALFSTWHSDVFVYLSGPARAAAFPAEAIDFGLDGLSFEGPPVSHYYFLPYTYEYWLAGLAYLSGASFTSLSLVVAPAVVAALIPLAWYRLVAHFTKAIHPALAAVGCMLIFLIVTGDSPRSYGHFGILRLTDNKGVFINLMLPLIAARLIALRREGGRAHAVGLFVLITSAAGVTLNALFMVPTLVAILAVALLITDRGDDARPPRRFLVLAGASHAYLFLVLILYGTLRQSGFRSWADPETVSRFSSHLESTFGPFSSTQSVLALISMVLCAWWWRRRPMLRLVLVWSGLLVLFVFNPGVYHLIRTIGGWGEMTSYWRFAFVAPLPLAFGVCWLPLLEHRLTTTSRLIGFGVAVGLATALFTLVCPDRSTYGSLLEGGGGPFGPRERPGLNTRAVRLSPFSPWAKLNGMEDALERLKDCDLPSPMLSSRPFSIVLPVFRPDVLQLVIKGNMMQHLGVYRGDRDLANRHLAASEFTYGKIDEFRWFRALVEGRKPRALLMKSKLVDFAPVKDLIDREGFEAALDLPEVEHTLWLRSGGS